MPNLIENYGVDHPMRNESIFLKQMKSAFRVQEIDGIYYQGSYELDFLIFTKYLNLVIEKGPKINYLNRVYHPDFFIKEKNLIVEIKSTYTFQKEFENNLYKRQACLDLGYRFLFVIDKDYTEFIEFILKWFDIAYIDLAINLEQEITSRLVILSLFSCVEDKLPETKTLVSFELFKVSIA